MLASNTLTYGLFRVWKLQREGHGFEAHVFRDFEEELAWLEQLSVSGCVAGISDAPSCE